MNPAFIPQNSRSFGSFNKNEPIKPSSLSKSSFRIHHYNSSNPPNPVLDNNGRPKLVGKHSYSSKMFMHDPILRSPSFHDYDEKPALRSRIRKRYSAVSKSSGLIYTTRTNSELSSIDKINDPNANALVCAGKTHLGIYKFCPEDKSIKCSYDLLQTGSNEVRNPAMSFLPKRGRAAKLSTIADVKAGFQNYKNHIAICTNSTAISLYDLNKYHGNDNPLMTSLSEHTRSVNSFDFNMEQTNLIISGGQDGCVKIWDMRSNKFKSSACDISINTAYDSIRDIKWMPSYNFTGDRTNTEGRSQQGYKFASVHDSGVLLKFDLRQPNQFERKINAHTGPALCLNWYPHQDYIVTGGRDGKCCLWYFGDKVSNETNGNSSSPYPHQMNNHYGNTSNNLVAFPETTINMGSPITKLKFRPAYEPNISNSLLAVSSMGQEAQVKIYSLARKYIPKHVLETSAPSVGLVWWDHNTVFNIDKYNAINGWEIDKEPTVLDNLPKSASAWRDMDGNGLLMLDQEIGSYEIEEESKNSLQTNRERVGISYGNTVSSSGLMSGLKKGISQTTLPAFSNERPSIAKVGPSISSKSLVSSSSHNNSSTPSLYSLTAQAEFVDIGEQTTPTVITLDLPHILNRMRISQIKKYKRSDKITNISIMRDSPVDVFKYLARELEFSFSERNTDDQKTVVQEASLDEEETEKDLMKKFGFSENSTWTNLIYKKGDGENAPADGPSSGANQITGESSEEMNGESSNETKSNISERIEESSFRENSDADPVRLEAKHHKIRADQIDLILELISVASHNASVYGNMDDLQNFKIWILIRDSLLWDLKRLNAVDENPKGSSITSENKDTMETSKENANSRKGSIATDYSKFTGSEQDSSFIVEYPKALRSKSEEIVTSPETQKSVSKLKQQLEKEDKFSKFPNLQPDQMESETFRNLSELRKQQSLTADDSNNSVLDDVIEDINQIQNTQNSSSVSSQNGATKGIPILQQRHGRTSFIDTFMTDMYSPTEYLDDRFMEKHTKASSLVQSSPRSKISSLHSFSPGHMSSFKKFSPKPKGLGSPPEVLTFQDNIEFNMSECRTIESQLKTKERLPPWNTKKLLRQLYEQAVETGNILLAVNILLLFQNVYVITSKELVKNTLSDFITLLHRYELFEIATAFLKYCPWESIMGMEGSQSLVQLYCDRCGELITNEHSKQLFTLECKKNGDDEAMERFGYWYCDACKKPNSLCVLCQKPVKKLAIALIGCGHEGHFKCFSEWFLDEEMDCCPGGCLYPLNL